VEGGLGRSGVRKLRGHADLAERWILVSQLNHRLLDALGYIPPTKFEEAYYKRQQAPATPAVVT